MNTIAYTLLHRYSRFLAVFAFVAALSMLAVSVHADNSRFSEHEDEAQQRQERALQSAFETIRAVGEASNNGAGVQEAQRQACSAFQAQGARLVGGQMDAHIEDSALIEGLSQTKIGAALYGEGRSAVDTNILGALQMACAALTGEDAGTLGSSFSPERLQELGLQMAFDEGLARLKSFGLPFMGNIEVSGNVLSDGGAGWEVLSVQPLWHDQHNTHHVLTQLSWNHTRERDGYAQGDVWNGGLIYRRLLNDNTMMLGANVFFDHARQMNHNRMSIGGELQTSEFGAIVNRYMPLSDWKSVDDYIEERASSGWDLRLQGRLPQYPAWQANLTGYQWSSNQDLEEGDVYGYEAGLQWQPIKGLVVEAGVRDEQEAKPEIRSSMRLVYAFGDRLERMGDRPVALADVSARVYDKVERENAMRVVQRIKDSAYVRVTQNIGANSAAFNDGSTQSLSVGQDLPRPFTLSVDGSGGAIARLVFRDGAVLTVSAGSVVRVEASVIALISGAFQFVSGSANVTINIPGGSVTLLGTDIDVSSDGTTSVLRVRDGGAVLTGGSSGAQTLAAQGAASAVSGVVGAALADTDPVYIAHTDEISTNIDRVAAPLEGIKVAPYPISAPSLNAPATSTGEVVALSLVFNDPVSVSGAPQLVMDIGGASRNAIYASGTGSDTLVFNYTLQAADVGNILAMIERLDLNGGTISGNGKAAVSTIADVTLNLTGSGDINVPAGYGVAFTSDPIGGGNYTAATIQMTNAEVGTTYNYTITSNNGGTPVTGMGAVASATQDITGIDLSGLGDGTLTVSLTLTDAGNNVGAVATDTVAKDVITLGLDFVAGAYSLNGTSYASFTDIPGASFSRASPATTYAEDSAGNLVAFTANTPRITDKGLLLEGERTNIILHSQNFSAGVWGAGRVTKNINQPDPIGTNSAVELVVTGGSDPIFSQNVSPISSGNLSDKTFIYSFWLRAGIQNAGETLCSRIFSYGSTGVEQAQRQDFVMNSTWQRYSFARTFPSGMTSQNAIFRIDPYDCTSGGTNTPSAGSSVFVWGVQVEEASFVSSYIPTSGSTVTRNADTMFADISALDLSTGYSVVFAGAVDAPNQTFDRVYQFDDNNTDNRQMLNYNGSVSEYRYISYKNAGLEFFKRSPVTATGVDIKVSSRITQDNNNVAFDGVAETADTSADFVEPTRLWFASQTGGGPGSKPDRVRIYKLNLYDSLKTDAQLEALSTP